MRIWGARDSHHFPIQPLSIDIWDSRGLERRFLGGITERLFLRGGKVLDIVSPPSCLVAQILLELAEEGIVEKDLSALETLPGAVGTGGGDGVVDPVWGDVFTLFVVEDGLEGRHNLK